MYVPAPTMDGERYQDLSELVLFGSSAQPWAAAEGDSPMEMIMHSDGTRRGFALENNMDYNLNDVPFYSMTRTDSMEEVKAVTAPMEVVPMRHHEVIQVQDLVKTEDIDFSEEVVEDQEQKVDPELLLFDTPDLLSELGDRDLIDFIVSDGSPKPSESPRSLHTPSPRRSSSPRFPYLSTDSSLKMKQRPMKETYLAIPRELTAGSSDDKKIPKMLILKTPQTSTINFEDIGMSIAERIKTVGKRQRSKKYSESADDDDEDYEDTKPSKRTRRLSTTSSASTSTSDRYRELRDKNNEASRKSRQNRKEKEKDLMKSLDAVEKENLRLRARSDELEKLVLSLRKLLLQIVVNKGAAR